MGSIEELKDNLDLLIGRRPPLVQHIERGPGQREDRYAHLLSGEVSLPLVAAPRITRPPQPRPTWRHRVKALEEQVAELRARLDAPGR